MDEKKLTLGNVEETRKLRQECRSIDKDGDGKVDKSEMDFFLKTRGVDEDHRL